MTQEEKQLLLKDICARLPYGVICNCVDLNFSGSVDWTLFKINLQDYTIETTNNEWNKEFSIENIKPYLRPMSSMTEEEKECYEYLCSTDEGYRQPFDSYHLVDWLIKNKFDYRGLIEKGLALEAPDEMYK